MSKNIPEVQDNQKFILHFDRVDLLKKQLDDLIKIIENSRNLNYINDLRDKIVITLGEITDSQRLKINGVLREADIFEKISDKQRTLRQQSAELYKTNPIKKSFRKPEHHYKSRHGFKNALKSVPNKTAAEISIPDGRSNTLICGGVTVDVIEWKKIVNEKDEKGKSIEVVRGFVKVIAIKGGKLPKISVGNVYAADSLPLALRFAYYPEAKLKYEAEQAEREAAKLQGRRALSAANKGKKGKQKGKQDKAA